ncbi:MAG TPA: DNA translocase FtsK [Bacillota bacterium]|nr:DNA translocase FtsK [Bacillota bacterium]
MEKFKNLFRNHTDENDAANKKNWQQHEIHSKVMYHYPKRNSFRFPLIPDEPREKDTFETPTYKRRNTRRDNSNVHSKRFESKGHTYRPTKVKKDSNKPFRPSQVASPIHGYRNEGISKNVTNVPAYVRKQEKSDRDSMQVDYSDVNHALRTKTRNELKSDERESDHALRTKTRNGLKSDEQENKQASRSDQLDSSANNEVMPKETNTIQNKQTVPEETENGQKRMNIKQNQNKTINQSTVNSRKQSRSKRKQRIPEQKPVPFNVMMSHNDKQYIRQSNKRKQATKTMEQSDPKQPGHIPYHLLNDKKEDNGQDRLWVRNQQELLEKTLSYFNVDASVVNAVQGPSVTRFEVQPALGVKVSKVKNLSDDIKLNLAAQDIRIEAPIPGKHTIGIEIPNPHPKIVSLQEILSTESFNNQKSPLTIGLGLTIEGNPSITNIQKMPHGLIAGATGSGKSVCINTILISLLYKADHESVKFLLIDPKMVELAPYNGIPHLISPVITDVKAATMALKWAVKEMEHRYDKFVHEGVRDVERYNSKMIQQGRNHEKLPYIVVVIDELADLMMVSPQDVEDSICRIAQKARACGIHLLLATQRPSVDVITGLIKANIPTRIAFSVSSQVDSRTVIDASGAEKLLGKGDMLFVENGAGKSARIQGAFVSDEEIERVTQYARSIAEPQYEFEQEQLLEKLQMDDNEDELLEEVIEYVVEQNNASTSLLQRHFKIGYNRAARLMDAMVEKGIISEQKGSKPRDVLVTGTSVLGE